VLRIEPLRVSPPSGFQRLAELGTGIAFLSRWRRAKALDKCPPEGGERRYRADGPRWKNSARRGGRRQSAGELRSPLSRCGFAFAPDSTPLGACGPQNRLEAVSAPPLGYPEREGPPALRLEKEGGAASTAAPEPQGGVFVGLVRGRVGRRRFRGSWAVLCGRSFPGIARRGLTR